MHWTVKPGKYCIAFFPPAAVCRSTLQKPETDPKNQDVGANCGARNLWCQAKTPQDVGVPLPKRSGLAGTTTQDVPKVAPVRGAPESVVARPQRSKKYLADRTLTTP
jgi:hypothetical protein